MKYGAPSILGFARDAGFAYNDLTVAAACALAGSGGNDNYDHAAGIPGAGRWVGLWAINTDEWPDYTPDRLRTAQESAQAAYELTQRCAGFGWSAVWRTGTDRRYYAHVTDVFTHPPGHELEHVPVAAHHAQRMIEHMGRRLATRSNRG